MQDANYHTLDLPDNAIAHIERIVGHTFNRDSYTQLTVAFTSNGNHQLAQLGEALLRDVIISCISVFGGGYAIKLSEHPLWIPQLVTASHGRTKKTHKLAPFLRFTTRPSDEELKRMAWALLAVVWEDTNRNLDPVRRVVSQLGLLEKISLHPTEDIFPL